MDEDKQNRQGCMLLMLAMLISLAAIVYAIINAAKAVIDYFNL